MRKSFLFISLALLLVLFSFCPSVHKTDWQTMGLKGQVKKLTEVWLQGTDTIFTQVHHFSKEGLLYKLETKQGKSNPYTYELSHDKEGYTTLITHVNNLGTPLTVYTFSKENKGDTVILKSKITYNISSEQLEYENYYVNNLLVKEHYLNPRPMMPPIVQHEYDEKGWETKTRYIYSDTVRTRSYEYLRVDRSGNWTQKAEADKLNESINMHWARKIIYY